MSTNNTFLENHPLIHIKYLLSFSSLQCKHLLAVKISEAMEVIKTLEVSDQEIADIITQVD